MDVSRRHLKLRKSINAPVGGRIPLPSPLSQRPIRSKIDNGTFLYRLMSKLEFLSVRGNGTCLRATISLRSWSRDSCVRRQVSRSQSSIWMDTKRGDYFGN